MKVLIETFVNEGEFVAESSKRIDWNNASDRKWLMNHMHWAMHNSRQVNVYAPEAVCAHESN